MCTCASPFVHHSWDTALLHIWYPFLQLVFYVFAKDLAYKMWQVLVHSGVAGASYPLCSVAQLRGCRPLPSQPFGTEAASGLVQIAGDYIDTARLDRSALILVWFLAGRDFLNIRRLCCGLPYRRS
jgi:hypothetical protein